MAQNHPGCLQGTSEQSRCFLAAAGVAGRGAMEAFGESRQGVVRGACLCCVFPVSGRVGSGVGRRWGRKSVPRTLKKGSSATFLIYDSTCISSPVLETGCRAVGRQKSLMWEPTKIKPYFQGSVNGN